jgi:hypothetical protein
MLYEIIQYFIKYTEWINENDIKTETFATKLENFQTLWKIEKWHNLKTLKSSRVKINRERFVYGMKWSRKYLYESK